MECQSMNGSRYTIALITVRDPRGRSLYDLFLEKCISLIIIAHDSAELVLIIHVKWLIQSSS